MQLLVTGASARSEAELWAFTRIAPSLLTTPCTVAELLESLRMYRRRFFWHPCACAGGETAERAGSAGATVEVRVT